MKWNVFTETWLTSYILPIQFIVFPIQCSNREEQTFAHWLKRTCRERLNQDTSEFMFGLSLERCALVCSLFTDSLCTPLSSFQLHARHGMEWE